MNAFLRYLLSLGIQIAWQRSGRGGAVLPIRMPFGKNKGKTIPLPIIGPWQMMAAMWIIQRIWKMYGHQIKERIGSTNHPLAGHLHDLLPDTPGAPSINRSTPASAAQSTQSAPSPSTTRLAPQYNTQPLSSVADTNTNGTSSPNIAPLPSGSVLNKLRGTD